ncbi:DEAD/DEAH box helicase family protein [Roseovarius sp. LXJ103]|uniref:type I restriction endonuclease subunit R n=1 Tax=Roseovarius carneus TaxID=2853164 RepID=UPI000D62128D|nr:DEAD/DEAH box helicase family protein [Roseovarius carneus]MBZ8117380.1 DEAD/DEAH box helicase family protein [Roseovarius carneus]PWE36802.1 DEAD/DEAH box helicase [Pelagicola sp. LXJ1103]
MTTTHTSADIHQEKVFEAHIVACLTADQGYVQRDCVAHYDVAHALDTELLFRFLKTTQPEAWQTLEDHYSAQSEAEVLKRLDKALKENPTHVVLREGIKLVPNIRFALCFFKPASNLNPDLTRLFEANILSVMRQVHYSAKDPKKSIDIVTFVNGIPVATLEVKNLLTKQNVKHAEKQYRQDRSPAGEPLLTFKRGAIVHFALDQDNVSMTTRLMNGKTRFLPFNRGRDGGAGNPDVPNENRVAYLYKDLPEGRAVFSREVLLDLIGRFIHLERSDGKEVLIFPRFQQFDAVRKVLADARMQGAGQNYLIQHSAGSGKSNTIAWTAHQIINLHDEEDQPLFDTAIIVTDRLVLDRQLQNTIGGFAQTEGVVKKIDGTSRDLKDAILKGARIIITTIQKFGTEHLATISGQAGRNFAVIIDEAHSSQSGKAAQAMSDALTRDPTSSDEIEDMVLAFQKARGPQKNISFLAFTATPRNVTLERFGRIGADGKPHPFHLYSMRQAIEEEFIVDVLKNYMTYKAYYQLEKTIEDDPAFKGRKAQSRVARYASLHPTAIDQKVEVIVEHFRRHVARELAGQAKAMIVTQSREHALRYWQQLTRYIEDKGYSGLKALVAFSGDLTVDGNVWTEATANGFAETELPKKFDRGEYQVLVVAEKYQTGFDQPKLVAMYVDKKLAGLQAVQTLARLNRSYGKDKPTYVLDFQNTMEDIREAFAPFFETTALEERTDLNQIYDLEQRITNATYLHQDEVERFADQFFKGDLTTQDRLALEGTVRLAVERFKLDEDEAQQEEFRQLLKSFLRFYAFVAQVVSLNDAWLEKLYAYSAWLSRLLPSRDVPADITITDDMLTLSAFKLQKGEEGSASLVAGQVTALSPITEFGANPYTEEEERSLSEIIDSFNERHGTSFSREDFLRFERVTRDIMDEDMTEMVRNNPADVVYNAFSQAFFQGMVKMFQNDNEMRNIVMTDKDAREQATRHFFKRAQRTARKG